MLLFRKSTCHLVCLLVIAVLVPQIAAQDSSQAARESACRQFAQNFYSWYVPLMHKRTERPAFAIAIERRPEAFAPALRSALDADAKAQEKAHDDIIGIDFDPFVNSQDPADRYDANKVSFEGDKCLVEVRGNPSKKSAPPDAVAEMSQQAGGWRFDNFRYPDQKTDLVSILDELRKQREKQQ